MHAPPGGPVVEIARELQSLVRERGRTFVTQRAPEADDAVPVFTFHGAPREFAEQARYLAENGYRTLTAGELRSVLAGGAPAGRAVALTFDDGLASVWTQAKAVLDRFAFRATAFIVPAWVGRPGYLTWRQIRDMRESGVFDVQSHTLTHRAMVCRTPADVPGLKSELVRSREVLEKELPGHRVEHLCYPFGMGGAEAVRLSREAGYVTNFWGRRADRWSNRPGDDPYHIVRNKHDYIFRLPGRGRRGLLAIGAAKLARRFRGDPYA